MSAHLGRGTDASGAPDPTDFRSAMKRLPSGVTILTTHRDGADHAMTADSFVSVSLDPVLVLVCIQRTSRFCEAVLTTRLFGVSVLAGDQEDLSRWFATRGRPLAGQLDQTPYSRGAHTGAALLDGALAHVECRVSEVHAAGDHVIVVAEVLAQSWEQEPTSALVHYLGRYGTIS